MRHIPSRNHHSNSLPHFQEAGQGSGRGWGAVFSYEDYGREYGGWGAGKTDIGWPRAPDIRPIDFRYVTLLLFRCNHEVVVPRQAGAGSKYSAVCWAALDLTRPSWRRRTRSSLTCGAVLGSCSFGSMNGSTPLFIPQNLIRTLRQIDLVAIDITIIEVA
jgi:hypothetical protein